MAKARAQIILEFHTPKVALTVSEAVAPDNSPLPPGMTLTVVRDGSSLLITIESDRGIDSLRGTIEDLMSAVDLSLRTISSLAASQQ